MSEEAKDGGRSRAASLVLALFVAAYLAWNYAMVAVCVWFGTGGRIAPHDLVPIVLAYVCLPLATALLLLRRWRGAVVMMVLAGVFAVAACGRPERPVPVSEAERAGDARYQLEERTRMFAELALVIAGIAIAGRQALRRGRRSEP
jgi:hypothetical protein